MISSLRSASRRLTGFQSTGHHKSAQKARKRAMASYSAACIELSQDNLCEEDDWDHFGDNKKRRLTFEQVKTLEKSFEVGNKLEVERKKQLATTLGLQPKQIAVWFQNRRVRWKTKQLEKDYNALKQAYDALKTNYDTLLQERTQFQDEVNRLNSELGSNCKERSTKSSALIKPTSKSVTEISAKSEMFIKTREACEKDSEDFGSSSIVSEGSSVLNLGNPRTIENPLSPQFTVRDVPCELIRRLLAEQSGYGPKFLPKWEEESVVMNEGEETWCNLFLGCEGQGPTFWDYYSHES